MWYETSYPATWAGLNTFLSGVLSLFSNVLSAIMTQPILVLILSALLLAVVFALCKLLLGTAKKM